jgi:hypothetical protein
MLLMGAAIGYPGAHAILARLPFSLPDIKNANRPEVEPLKRVTEGMITHSRLGDSQSKHKSHSREITDSQSFKPATRFHAQSSNNFYRTRWLPWFQKSL